MVSDMSLPAKCAAKPGVAQVKAEFIDELSSCVSFQFFDRLDVFECIIKSCFCLG